MVRAHERTSAAGNLHLVKAHIRRLELMTLDELKDLTKVYGFKCPECSGAKLDFFLYSGNNKLRVKCNDCGKVWEGRQQLTEETGPRLAELLEGSKNKGLWKARWDMLSSKTQGTFRSLTSNSHNKNKKKRKL